MKNIKRPRPSTEGSRPSSCPSGAKSS